MTLSFREWREGQQCLLRAWRSHEAAPAVGRAAGEDPLGAVRTLAASRFPDAIDARAGAGSSAEAVARTRDLVADGAVRIANASFDVAGLCVTVDVLERTPRGRWVAVLVRNAVRVSARLAERSAFTLHVLRSAGLRVAAVHALLLDPAYVRGDGGIDPAALFVRRSVSFPAGRLLGRMAIDVARVQAARALTMAPGVVAGAQCRDDRDGCPFLADCTSMLPLDWTGWLPRKDKPPIGDFLARGYVRMREVPEDHLLPRGAEHARRASRGSGRHVSPGLTAALARAGPPAFSLDFECVAPAIPAYAGTRPYDVIPFLWSVHYDDGTGGLFHVDDIAPPGPAVPRRRIAESLLAALGEAPVPILVYSSYERERLRELADALPDLAGPLAAIQARLVDLLEIVREHVYDLGFRGSFSIKQVAPVLAPALTYDDLTIGDGLAATEAYERLLASSERGSEADATTLDALRRYCARDTLATVLLHRALRALAASAA